MATLIRAALVAAVLCTAGLPAVAQQAAPAPAAEAAAPAAEAGSALPDLEATVQRLKTDLLAMTEAARQGTQDFLNRRSPYVITTDQLMAVAAGALAGAVVVDLLGGGGLASLTGAAVGGVAGHWIYTQPPAPLATPAPAPKG